ncbi:hypothetical protein HDU76_001648 [Blyttiomyces sp. JEL0837]|nr:hypothetical protein HDU76_001648 [Blyttiomyces sp. JEL0837]
MIMACGKVLYLWDIEQMTLTHKFGRLTGSVHRENITDCKFDKTASRICSAGEDKRIVVWNAKTHKAEKVMEGHKGAIFQVEFTSDGDRLLSCSDDGRVLLWEWRTGTILSSVIRYPSAVKSFIFLPSRPEKILCGRNDGHVTAWDTTVKGIVDDILPDPDWVSERDELSLVGWMHMEKHHSGCIMAIAVSPNERLLISAATDHTAKLWSITSYMKDIEAVQLELRNAHAEAMKLDTYIDVKDEKYEVQIAEKDFAGLRIGEVPIPMGYHADLIFTYRHEATVLCAKFNKDSE